VVSESLQRREDFAFFSLAYGQIHISSALPLEISQCYVLSLEAGLAFIRSELY